jgi:ATP-dependent Clp protease ATP-binding subunit ClpA
LSDEARAWLVKNGYDEAMGARPMARVIQKEIKTPLADEVLFGRLKNGGLVRVVVTGDESGVKKLGFVYPEGPAQPRLERDLLVAGRKRATDEPEVRKAKPRKRGEGDLPLEVDEDPSSETPPTEPQAI